VSVSERVYRWLLRSYPREFRDEYGEEMVLLFRERCGEARLRSWLQAAGDLLFHAPKEHWGMLQQDVRYALRTWRRAPAVPAIAVTALTLGMGANLAVFSVTNAVLLQPLPVREPGRVVVVQETRAGAGVASGGASFPNYLSWKEGSRSLDLAAYSGQALTWTDGPQPERLEAIAATASFLDVAGGSLQRGRWFTEDEAQSGQPGVVVLSNRLWRQRFGADRGILGRSLILNSAPYTVIGIASPRFSVPSEPDLWVPQLGDPSPARRAIRYLSVVGRLKQDFTLAQAREEMSSVALTLEQEFPDANRDFRISLISLAKSIIPRDIRTALMVLQFAAGLVLLIACANVANVLLSRAVARRREIALRTALGAGAARITRQLLTESVLLSTAGAVLGLLLSAVIMASARSNLAGIVPRIEDLALDLTVAAFALGLIMLTAIGFGFAPVWHMSARPDAGLFQATGRDDRAPARARSRTVLVVTQVALTTMLVVGAALLMQSLIRLQRVPLGMNPESVATAKLSLRRAKLPDGTAIGGFLSRLTSALESTPGITAAGISSAIPLSPGAHTMTRFSADSGDFLHGQWRLVDAGYFRTFQIPLIRGRLFGPGDSGESPRVFVISQEAARALYGDENAVGRRLRLENGNTGEIVGVVADVRMRDLGESPERVVYFPPSQFGFFPQFNVVVRSDGRFDRTSAVIRDRLKDLDPALAAYDVQSMQHWIDRNAALMRIRTVLITSLGALALLLGVIGVYGTMSYLVAQRTREFGIRIALGARPQILPITVAAQGMGPIVAGIGLGLAAAAALVDRLRDLLFQVEARDPATFTSVAVLVCLVALAASYVPARRAATADPVTVLRAE
jgi:putative ABC transport system permease protein